MRERIPAGILCGGGSRRMGQDKAALPWGETTLLGRIVEEMEGSGRKVFLSVGVQDDLQTGKADAVFREGRSKNLAYRVYRNLCVQDEYPNRGPLEGIRRVLLESGADMVFFCAVDMPWVDRRTVEYLEQCWEDGYDCMVMESDAGIHPLCGIYTDRVLPVIGRMLEQGDRRVTHLLDACRVKRVRLEKSPLPMNTLANVNTKEQYELQFSLINGRMSRHI